MTSHRHLRLLTPQTVRVEAEPRDLNQAEPTQPPPGPDKPDRSTDDPLGKPPR
jgi:hypothetical protein